MQGALRRGSALLAVLWLLAALSAIAFSVAGTVRGEMERTSTALDGTRAYYLATGALERALLYMQWGQQYRNPDGSSRYYDPWTRSLRFTFPTGEAVVEIVPETAKLNLNSARPQDLLRLLAALGVHPDLAQADRGGHRGLALGARRRAVYGFRPLLSFPDSVFSLAPCVISRG